MSRKLTNAQVYAFILDRLDEAGSPRWDRIQTARVFNAVYGDWLRQTCREMERDEEARRELGPLTVSMSRNITSNRVDLDGLKPSVYRLLSVTAEWDRLVRDRRSQRQTSRTDAWPVSPIRHDQKGVAKVDPWNKPTDDKARYSESRQVAEENNDTARPVELTIHSETQPARIFIDYIHEPKLVDFRAEPEGKMEVGYDTQIELMRRTVAMLATTDENFPAAQAGYSEVKINT